MPAVSISASLRQAGVNEGAFQWVQVPLLADRDRLATEGVIRLGGLVTVGTYPTQVTYRLAATGPAVWDVWDGTVNAYTAATSTIYVDSATGDDTNAGDVGTPLATLAEAKRRIPDEGGTYEVQLVGAGPYANPGGWPTKSSVTVFADRSSPVATKNPARFTASGGAASRTAQKEDASFGAVATTVGTHWCRYYFDLFGLFAGYVTAPCLTRPSGTIGIVEGVTGLEGFEEEANVYAWTTVVNFERADAALPGGATFVGCIISSTGGGGVACDGYNFSACRATLTAFGNLTIRNGTFGGYITGNSTLVVREGGSAFQVYMGSSSRIDVDGGLVSYVVDVGSNRLRITGDTTLTGYDLESSTGIEVSGAARVILRSGYLNNPSKFIRPRSYSSGNPTMARAVIQFVDPVTGTCVDGIELVNGSALIQNGNLSGLAASNYDVRLDGVDFAFGEQGFSLDTGGFTR